MTACNPCPRSVFPLIAGRSNTVSVTRLCLDGTSIAHATDSIVPDCSTGTTAIRSESAGGIDCPCDCNRDNNATYHIKCHLLSAMKLERDFLHLILHYLIQKRYIDLLNFRQKLISHNFCIHIIFHPCILLCVLRGRGHGRETSCHSDPPPLHTLFFKKVGCRTRLSPFLFAR